MPKIQGHLKKISYYIKELKKKGVTLHVLWLWYRKEYCNIFNPFFCKRKEYEYEKKFRIATYILIELDPTGRKDTLVGLSRKADANLLIEKIIISPYFNKSYKKSINQIAKRFGISNRISKSELDSKTVF